jgi:hypothetical protein
MRDERARGVRSQGGGIKGDGGGNDISPIKQLCSQEPCRTKMADK